MLLDLLGINKAIKQIKCRLQKLEKNTNTGGDFVPLTGTEVGNPVTGDIEINSAKLFTEKSGETFELNFQEKFIGYKALEGKHGISFDPAGGVITTKVIDEVNNIGLLGDADFSETFPENKLIYAQRSYVDKAVSDSRPYKVYTALLTQTGTNAPVATVLENTLGGDIVWSRGGSGYYIATSSGLFTENKTGFFIEPSSNSIITSFFETNTKTINTIEITSRVTVGSADNRLFNTLIEIRVYN